MRDLFYCKEDGYLFWVAGYTRDGNTSSVSEQVKDLTENANTFANIANTEFEQVQTYFINASRRYKYMRMFYVKTTHIPEDAFIIENNDWTMWKWIQY